MTESAAARTTTAPPPPLLRAAPAHDAPLPALRLLPAPSCEPPYDDELTSRPVLRLVATPAPPRRAAVPPPSAAPVPAGTVPAAPVPISTVPAAPGPTTTGPAGTAPAALPADRRPRTPTGELPAARPFAVAFVHRLLEVCGGVRPVLQLQRDTSPSLYQDLEQALVRRPRPEGPRPGGRDVRSVHVQERPDGVVEVCATVRRGTRVGALALRLEGVQGRWLCTQLQGV